MWSYHDFVVLVAVFFFVRKTLVLICLHFPEKTRKGNSPSSNGTPTPLPGFDCGFECMHGNYPILSIGIFLFWSSLWVLKSCSFANRIKRMTNIFLHSKNAFTIYRFSFWVIPVLKRLCDHTDKLHVNYFRKLKIRGSVMVDLEYMDGGSLLLRKFKRGKWYITSGYLYI
jgi:hypothetical protein